MHNNNAHKEHIIQLPAFINLNSIQEIRFQIDNTKRKDIILDGQYLQQININCFILIKKMLINEHKNYELFNFQEKFLNIWNQITITTLIPAKKHLTYLEKILHTLTYKINIFYISWELFEKIFLYKMHINKMQRKLIYNNFLSNINEIGLKSLPVFALIMFFLGIVITFQGAYQLTNFAAELYVVDFLALSVFRELGPILTGIIIASRTGSAITAQIGTMKNNDELTMLSLMGLNPVKFILLPKILALVFISPFITLFACIMATLGGLTIFVFYMHYSSVLFFSLLHESLSANSFFMFAWKGPLFCFLIGLIACTQGMIIKPNAIDLSKKITSSVVAGLISVLITDGVISVLSTFIE